ncbi:choice-of-anchor Q domain-containing protein [Cyanobacterium aponinum AL20118]|uniref:Choice-of-anchor Q domain-containing protein n=1 Tax=Cyanobacterium aponinum AL20115 TaxID=3090662 RepID=A0AAF0ZIL9_9CHRO|nr:choice-of-anchor Q domain-containing protein [Cyanobacterium aponinum]WPF90259.1 choice-of-anchor Q domain-containing protein [Cyanobacterium aponinum AL20115]
MADETILLNVTTTEDQNDGSSFQGLSLRDAILIANADPDNHYTINLPAGTYNLTIKNVLLPTTDTSADAATLFQSRLATGDLDIIGNITIIGEDPENTIIDAESLTQPLPPDDSTNPFPDDPPVITPTIGDRVFDVLSGERSGKTLQDGSPANGSLNLQNVTIKNGAMTEENIDATFAGGTINGGVLNIDLNAQTIITNSIIADSSTTLQGGGINNSGTLTLEKTIVSGHNSGDNAGGIYNTGIMTIRDSAIINNLADAAAPDIIEGGGGGILNEAGATLIMVNTTVSGNRSASNDGNDPPSGPGDGGGGILSRGTTRIINSTIVNNSAQVGSGIYSETTTANTILYNTIIANNTGSPDLDGFFDSRSGFNFVPNANGLILDAKNGNIVGGTTTQRLDLNIGPLQDNGGPTPTHALLPGSPAINAGDTEQVNILFYFPDDPPLDQRGSERISDGRIDIGSYEVFVETTGGQETVDNSSTPDTTTTGVNNNTGSENPETNPDTTTTGVNNNTGSENPETNPDTTTTGVNNNTGSENPETNPDTTTTGVNENSETETGSETNPDTTTTGVNENSDTETDSETTTNIPDNSNPEVVGSETTDSLLNDPFYRFQNSDRAGTYLYVGAEERTDILNNYSPPFIEEGLAFNVSYQQQDGLIRFNRFQSMETPGTYLFASEEESVSIRQNHSNTFDEEGIAFYAYGADAGIGQDVFRYQSKVNPGTYLFVLEAEKNTIDSQHASDFTYEGVAFEVIV